MSNFRELAEQLRAHASSENIPISLLLEAQRRMDQLSGQVSGLIDQGSDHYPLVIGALSQSRDALDNAIAALKQAEKAIHDAADYYSR